MERTRIEAQLLEGCRRLADKSFLNNPADSFSLRLPGTAEMVFTSGHDDWRLIGVADLHVVSLECNDGLGELHASIYRERGDVGAVAISSPEGARLLARHGGRLPPVFDEQVRHLGPSAKTLVDDKYACGDMLGKTFSRGANAVLLGEQLLCLGMTCERVLLNTELYEKCAQAYVIASASGSRIGLIPPWVRIIANRRLLQDERRAVSSYRRGCIPQDINAY